MEPLDLHGELLDRMIAAGWLQLTSAPGIMARSGDFLTVERALFGMFDRMAAGFDGVRALRFPPVFPADWYVRTGYLANFPQLTGAVKTFSGSEREALALLDAQGKGEDWTAGLEPSGLMMVSVACHPAYGLYGGPMATETVLLDIEGWCFRHEPTVDPIRAICFRQREWVRIGTPEQSMEHRDFWIGQGRRILTSLGIPVEPEVANDPFFGRGGKMLATNQREENRKTELTTPLFGEDDRIALFSSNYHRDHFGVSNGITLPDGSTAHSACAGFGIERVIASMFGYHGPDLARWPQPVLDTLAL